MAGGERDSSLTRVQPTFDQLYRLADGTCHGESWIEVVVGLCSRGPEVLRRPEMEAYLRGTPLRPQYEFKLDPPRALLEHYLRNPGRLSWPENGRATYKPVTTLKRRKLLARDALVEQEGLTALRGRRSVRGKAWYLFEGTTMVDVRLQTTAGLQVLVEGKRTESGLTDEIEWDGMREQVYRNLDCGAEALGRACLQVLIVEKGTTCEWQARDLDLDGWERAARSMPHRSRDDVKRLWNEQYAGWTTWQAIKDRFPLLELADLITRRSSSTRGRKKKGR